MGDPAVAGAAAVAAAVVVDGARVRLGIDAESGSGALAMLHAEAPNANRDPTEFLRAMTRDVIVPICNAYTAHMARVRFVFFLCQALITVLRLRGQMGLARWAGALILVLCLLRVYGAPPTAGM